MRLTKNDVQKLDYLLNLGLNSIDGMIEADASYIPYDECEFFGDILKSKGLGEWIGGHDFLIYTEGKKHIKSGGFNMSLLERQEKEERERRQDLLTQKQIAAAKREPYLMAWGIIATIISLILGILQFCNS